MLVPASAATVKSVYNYTDGEVTWTDGVYNRYTLEIPLEHCIINVLRHADETVIGLVQGKVDSKITVDMEESCQYAIIFSLSPNYPISMDGLPSETKFHVEWEFYDNINCGYVTPSTHAFVDYYSGSDGVGSKNTKVSQNLWDIDLDGTGHYAIEPLEHDGYITRDESNSSADSFCFGFSFRRLTPFESGEYTIYLKSVKFHIYIPASLSVGDEMQDIIDKENEKAESSGNKFVDQILGVLPDPSTDVLASLKSLTDATAYTGTDAVLPIPGIVLPGINGLFPETVIWGGGEIDFSEYVNLLPSSLLTLVQSLFTIAIVLYCVYELKGIISYCFTLRENKGG